MYQTKNLSELHTWEQNPKTITPEAFGRLKNQIQLLGVYKPLLVTDDGTIIGGNSRFAAMKELEITEADCSMISFQQDEQGLWFAILNGQPQVKKFKTKEDGMMEYALSDNDEAGYIDEKKAELIFPTMDIDWDMYAVISEPTPTLAELMGKDTPPIEQTPDSPEIPVSVPVEKPVEEPKTITCPNCQTQFTP